VLPESALQEQSNGMRLAIPAAGKKQLASKRGDDWQIPTMAAMRDRIPRRVVWKTHLGRNKQTVLR